MQPVAPCLWCWKEETFEIFDQKFEGTNDLEHGDPGWRTTTEELRETGPSNWLCNLPITLLRKVTKSDTSAWAHTRPMHSLMVKGGPKRAGKKITAGTSSTRHPAVRDEEASGTNESGVTLPCSFWGQAQKAIVRASAPDSGRAGREG